MPCRGLCLGWNSGWEVGGLVGRNRRELADVDGSGIGGRDDGRLGFSVRAGEFATSGVWWAGSGLGRIAVMLDSSLKTA